MIPHQYFVRVMRAVLRAIQAVEPRAHVDMVIFSEGWYGGMLVDEVGLPVNWNIPSDDCQLLGLTCTQVSNSTLAAA